ncbi:MAG: BUG/TctC family periplasmic protein, partial [uncultured Ramlibacter sp.]
EELDAGTGARPFVDGCRLAADDGGGAGLPDPDRAHRRAVPGRRHHRHPGAHAGAGVVAEVGPDRGGGEPRRRQRHDLFGAARAHAAGRPHADADGHAPRHQPGAVQEPQVRHARRLHADRADRRRAERAGDQSHRAAGAQRQGAGRPGQGQSRQAEFRIDGYRRRQPPGGRAVQHARRREDRARSLQGSSARAQRLAGRPDPDDVRLGARRAAAHQDGQAAGAGGELAQALRRPARRADTGRVWPQRLRGHGLVRALRARQDVTGAAAEAVDRLPAGAAVAAHPHAVRRPGRRAGDDDAAAVRRVRRVRTGQVVQGDRRRRREDRL